MTLIKKWLFRLMLLVVFIVAMLAASDNSTQVPLTFLEYTTPVWPISWWMLAAFLVGVLFGTVLNTWSNTKLRLNARSANKQVAKVGRALDEKIDETIDKTIDKMTDETRPATGQQQHTRAKALVEQH